jgi:UDP-GlcNAc3NAcA epimerase
MMTKILTIIGARPQFVKAAAISRAFIEQGDIEEIIVHTGQHFDANMSDIFFEEMNIPAPNYNLNINSLGHGAMTGRMLEEIEKIILKENPDFVMVFGDTNSTLAGALAAKKLHIKVIHVEAGLRSFNMRMPEEVNRILTDRISDILLCPTQQAVDNLKKEGYDNIECKVINCGDVMQDAAMYYAQNSSEQSSIITKCNLFAKPFCLATIHRQENTDDESRLAEIIDALNNIAEKEAVIVPLHPRTRKIIDSKNIDIKFTAIDPVGYFDMIELLKGCSMVLTDSGGLQKEAFFFKKHCITFRDETEWVELVNNGFNIITGANKEKIESAYNNFKTKDSDFSIDLYGGGTAANRIAKEVVLNV